MAILEQDIGVIDWHAIASMADAFAEAGDPSAFEHYAEALEVTRGHSHPNQSDTDSELIIYLKTGTHPNSNSNSIHRHYELKASGLPQDVLTRPRSEPKWAIFIADSGCGKMPSALIGTQGRYSTR